MLANFFSKSKPINFILIIVLFLGYYIIDLFSGSIRPINLDRVVHVLLVFVLFLVLFFLYNFIITKNKLTHDNSYAFLLFVLSLGSIQEVVLEYKSIGIYIVLFLLLRRIYSLRTLKSAYEKLFDSGFWLGVLFLFSPYYLLYLVLIYLAVFLFFKVTFRTILIPIIGLVTPVFLYFTYLFWFDDLITFYKLFEITIVTDFSFYTTSYYSVFLTILGFFSLSSILLISRNIFSVSNKFKRSWVLLLVHLVVAIAFIALVNVKSGIELIAVLIPATIIIANWLQTVERKLIINIVLLLFLALSFGLRFIV